MYNSENISSHFFKLVHKFPLPARKILQTKYLKSLPLSALSLSIFRLPAGMSQTKLFLAGSLEFSRIFFPSPEFSQNPFDSVSFPVPWSFPDIPLLQPAILPRSLITRAFVQSSPTLINYVRQNFIHIYTMTTVTSLKHQFVYLYSTL